MPVLLPQISLLTAITRQSTISSCFAAGNLVNWSKNSSFHFPFSRSRGRAQVGKKKRGHSIGKIDENYNKTDKALLPKSNEVRRVAKMTRKSLAYALEGQPVKIKMALDILFEEDPRSYIDAIAKLMNYAMPKLSSTEIKKDTDTKIEINLNEGATLDDIKNQIRGLEDADDIDYAEVDEE